MEFVERVKRFVVCIAATIVVESPHPDALGGSGLGTKSVCAAQMI